jgi:hypothetical protein
MDPFENHRPAQEIERDQVDQTPDEQDGFDPDLEFGEPEPTDTPPAAVLHYDEPDGNPQESGGSDEPPPDVYLSVYVWWEQWMCPRYQRSLYSHARAWCPEFWRHPEALSRLYWMWRAWEQMHRDPAGLVSWWTYYADHNMTVLLSADGPFMDCKSAHHEPTDGDETSGGGTRPLTTPFDHPTTTQEVP